MTTLTVTATHNYTGDSLPANITDIVFNGSANTFATFAATQFGGSPISDSVHITGDAFTDTIIVNVSGTFSAAGWTFSSWSTADHTLLAGSAGADTITGTSGSDAISGEGGADTLDGGGGDDSFDYDPASEIVAGESVNGGTGTDRIIIAGGGAFDFSVATLTSVEEIDFGSPDAMTATFAGNQIGGSRITVVQGNTNDVDSLIVNGPSVDLSAVTFNLWTDGTDTITINGTSGVTNTLVGSSQNDTISGLTNSFDSFTGGGGADTMTGGNGNDFFIYTAAGDVVSGESLAGDAGTDKITLNYTGSNDFSLATITGIESLDYVTGTASATFSGAQIGLAAITSVDGSAGTDTLIVNAAPNVNLSGVTFTTWTDGTDQITINGTSGANTLTGSAQADTIVGGNGADTISAGNGNDIIQVGAGDFDSGESINGGGGTDTLRVTGTIDFTGGTLTSLEALTFATSAFSFPTFASNQFGAGLSNTLAVTGDANQNHIVVDLSAPGAFSAASWTFTTWNSSDSIALIGTAGADTITAATVNTIISGGAGADTLTGGAGVDEFRYFASGEAVAGETVNGGGGADKIVVGNGASADFTGVTLTSIEVLQFTTGTGTVVLTGSQIGAATIASVVGNVLATDTLTVNAASNVDLSGVTFTNWTDGTDQITINGTSGANTLTGSAQADTIVGGNSADTISASNGDDIIQVGAGDFDAGESIDGGGGTDTLRVTGTVNFTGGTLQSLEALTFATTATSTVTFGSNQFGAGLSNALAITGDSQSNLLLVNLSAAGTFSAAGWTFNNWTTPSDVIFFAGTAGTDTITAATVGTTINGGAGADALTGGSGNDNFQYLTSSDAVAGETVNGGGGTDVVTVGNGGSINFTGVTFTSIEELVFGAGSTTAILTGNQIGTGAITIVADVSGSGTSTLIINAVSNVDLSGLIFSSWTNGTDSITINGTASTNILTGSGQNDIIDGAGGADSMAGGFGNDAYFVDNAGDVVTENANAGTDTVNTSVNYALTANVEVLAMLGSADLQGFGNSAANTLIGNSGNNLLDGGAGADGMLGGAGNDTYFVDNTGDGVVENANEGNDSVFASVNFTLGANVENLVMQGTADLQGFGNAGANVLNGNSGNNLLDGGAAADLMIGGVGNDSYFADDPSDSAFEAANQGNDTVFASCNYGIAADVETLVMQGSGDFQGYGNNQANTLYGNAGSNLLNAAGGVDLMVGGAGNDTYFVDDTSDACFEVANEGNDAVFAFCHYGLAADVETLVMQGSGDFQGYGSNQANTIFGNAGNNLINGAGGADTMIGGAGNDTYFVDNAGDGVVENSGEGTDAVFSTVAYGLTANVETLVLQGAGNIDGIGNALANSIFGNDGNNTLDGGAGADVLTGNAGNDTFVFRQGQGNGDTVVDFTGNGAAPGDSLLFLGYGAGATFTQNDATHWQVNFNGGALHEVITFMNGASIHPSDVVFV